MGCRRREEERPVCEIGMNLPSFLVSHIKSRKRLTNVFARSPTCLLVAHSRPPSTVQSRPPSTAVSLSSSLLAIVTQTPQTPPPPLPAPQSQSARLITPTRAPSSPTTAVSWTSLRPEQISSRPGWVPPMQATSSPARRWRHRMSQVWRPPSCRLRGFLGLQRSRRGSFDWRWGIRVLSRTRMEITRGWFITIVGSRRAAFLSFFFHVCVVLCGVLFCILYFLDFCFFFFGFDWYCMHWVHVNNLFVENPPEA